MNKHINFEEMKVELLKRGFELEKDLFFRKHYHRVVNPKEVKYQTVAITFEVCADNSFQVIRHGDTFRREIEIELAKDITALLSIGAIVK